MSSDNASRAGSPKKRRDTTSDPGQDAPRVEPYQLPRWDAQGKPVPVPASPKAKPGTGTVEDVTPESLKPPTASEIRQIHEDAYNEGFESGFEQGMKQGQASGQAEGYKAGYDSGEQEGLSAGDKAGREAAQQEESERVSAELAPLAGLFEQISALPGQQSEELESGLVALAVRIARNVIDAELALNPAHIQSLVQAAVQALPSAEERFTLEINPQDASYVERVADPHWNLVPTPAISRGGCVIRTRFSYVDYTLEHRYRQQVSNLLAHAGLSEHLTEMETPWPLPPAEPAPGAPDSQSGTDPETRDPKTTDSETAGSEIAGSETTTGTATAEVDARESAEAEPSAADHPDDAESALTGADARSPADPDTDDDPEPDADPDPEPVADRTAEPDDESQPDQTRSPTTDGDDA